MLLSTDFSAGWCDSRRRLSDGSQARKATSGKREDTRCRGSAENLNDYENSKAWWWR